ncbi:hypothetical protein WJX74_004099 [Apatococcus lobatus]|uniref:Phage tail collar domain-containing protein n=1 Tax=Apatococcus lobatus TaxID=904363 RepID=A0AAW1Q5H4_9CHLO
MGAPSEMVVRRKCSRRRARQTTSSKEPPPPPPPPGKGTLGSTRKTKPGGPPPPPPAAPAAPARRPRGAALRQAETRANAATLGEEVLKYWAKRRGSGYVEEEVPEAVQDPAAVARARARTTARVERARKEAGDRGTAKGLADAAMVEWQRRYGPLPGPEPEPTIPDAPVAVVRMALPRAVRTSGKKKAASVGDMAEEMARVARARLRRQGQRRTDGGRHDVVHRGDEHPAAGAVIAKGSTLPVGGVITCVPGSAALGVNNPSPAYTLDVTGNANVSGNTITSGVQTSSINAGGQALTIGTASTPGIAVTGGSAPMVGIFQAVPAYTLDVTGTARATTSVITPSINTSGQSINIANTVWMPAAPVNNNAVQGRVGILNNNPQHTLDVIGDALLTSTVQSTGVLTPYIAYAGQTGHTFDITSGGVGLYQGSPKYSLDITGNLQATTGMNTPSITAPSDTLKLGTNVYLNGGKVGVFQSSPGSGAVPSSMPSGTTLDVAGIVRFLGTTNELCFMQSQTSSGGSAYMALGDSISTNAAAYLQYNNNGGSNNSVYLGLYPTQNLTLTSNYVGVMNLNPQFPLDVGGNANIGNALTAQVVKTPTIFSPGALSVMPFSASNAVTLGGSTGSPTLTAVNGNLGVQQSNPQYTLDVGGGARVTGNAAVSSLSTGTIGNNGNGVSFGSDTVTVPKMVLPQAASFTGNVNELAGTSALLASSMPLGTVLPWSATSSNALPTGFVECVSISYAPALSRYVYYSLYKLLGFAYGGDGNQTFAVPDLGGRTICGYVPQGGDSRFPESGHQAGEQTVTLDTTMIPSHSHGVSDGGHSHSYNQWNVRKFSATGSGQPSADYNIGKSYQTNNSGANISIQNTGGGNAHDNMQPYTVMRYIISVGPNNPNDLVMNFTSNAGTVINAVKTGDSGYLNQSDTWTTFSVNAHVQLNIYYANGGTISGVGYPGPQTNVPFSVTTGFIEWLTVSC